MDGKVFGSSRIFIGECPTHGEVFAAEMMGHHSTYGAAQIKERYSKARQRRIAARLSPSERNDFWKSIEGKRHTTARELRHWDKVAGIVRMYATAGWMGPFVLELESEAATKI
jgi:hypothetical protein